MNTQEQQAKQELKEMRAQGRIEVLTIGIHGQVFMALKNCHTRPYQSNTDALNHFYSVNGR